MIILKTDEEMSEIEAAGHKLGPVFDFIKPYLKPGVSTLEIDRLCAQFIKDSGCTPSFPMEEGYHWSICASVNEGIIHQIPRKDKILKAGDLFKIDIGNVDKTGFQGDAARTFFIGEPTEIDKKLAECAEACFWAALKQVRPGAHVSDIGWAIQTTAESYGFSCLKEYGGHGIGRGMHEDPFIPNYGMYPPHRGAMLKAGMAICIEPMVFEGKPEARREDDGWGVVSVDGKKGAHYENTILIYPDHNEITTVDESVRKRLGKEDNR